MSENQNIEYKESWRDEYLKWICGFANAKGGKLYIGIAYNGKICGVSGFRKLLEDLPNKITSQLGIVKKNNKISNKEYQEISQISRETASRDLADLVEKGLIKSSGSKGAGSFYTLT